MNNRLFTIILIFHSLSLFAQSINGFIREDATGEPLSYANVFLSGTTIGTASNVEGYFVLPLVPPNSYELVVSVIGYKVKKENISLNEGQSLRLDFRLISQAIETEEVQVSAERIQFQKQVEPSRISLDMRQIEAIPGLVEPDVFRTLQLLPGVQTLNDFSSALYVRGSTPDQNLILMDGITVYNPYHLGGVFSTFNTSAIKVADFQAGGFPARYGGRLGSVLNIINREGNTEEINGSANISLISSKGLIEGPLPKWGDLKGSWMIAGRRTYFDLITLGITKWVKNQYPEEANYMPNNFFPYHFYDLVGKVNLDLNENHRLTASSFHGDDIYEMYFNGIHEWENDIESSSNQTGFNFDWRWGNFTNSLTWRWIISPKLIAKTFIASSNFRFQIDLDGYSKGESISDTDTSVWHSTNKFDTFDRVNDKSIETQLTWMTGKGHTVTAGFQQKDLNFLLGMTYGHGGLNDTNVFITYKDTALWMADHTNEQAIYIQDKWEITPVIFMQLGGRFSKYSYKKSPFFSPRIGFKFFLDDQSSLKFNWGKYYQFLTIANPADENFRFIDIWLAIPQDKLPPSSTHTILGFEHLNSQNILYRIETYYKDFDHLLTLKQSQMFQEDEGEFKLDPMNEFWDTDAYAYGVEGLIQKKSGKVKGWVGYTFAVTKWKTELHNWYAPKYDRTHTINAVADWQWTEKTHVGLTVSYSSGNPHTPVIGQSVEFYPDTWINKTYFYRSDGWLVGDKNSERYPGYFRVDLSFNKRKQFKKREGYREWYFQIINVTNHMNALMYVYDNEYDEKSGKRLGVRRFAVPMFPFFPTFGLKMEF